LVPTAFEEKAWNSKGMRIFVGMASRIFVLNTPLAGAKNKAQKRHELINNIRKNTYFLAECQVDFAKERYSQ